MNDRASSSVKSLYLLLVNHLVECIANDLNDGSNQQFFGAHSADESSKGYQDGADAVGAVDDEFLLELNIVVEFVESHYDPEPKSIKKAIELHDDCVDKESISQRRQSVAFDKGHQKAKTYQHHHVCVLKSTVPCKDVRI
jgi:hypothetical protein